MSGTPGTGAYNWPHIRGRFPKPRQIGLTIGLIFALDRVHEHGKVFLWRQLRQRLSLWVGGREVGGMKVCPHDRAGNDAFRLKNAFYLVAYRAHRARERREVMKCDHTSVLPQ